MPDTEVPGVGLLKKSPRRVPYLFSNEQIACLLRKALELGPEGSLRPHTYSTMLGLMASTGIRVGEAIYLHTDDVHLDSDSPRLEIRESKFRKYAACWAMPASCCATANSKAGNKNDSA
jgi:site-specific recombinase XerD